MKYFLGFVGVLILLFGLSWVIEGNDFFLYKYFGPKQANVQREIFENTQSFVQGKAEYIDRLRLDYEAADGQQKELLRRTILNEASTVDIDKLPEDEQAFIRSLRSAR